MSLSRLHVHFGPKLRLYFKLCYTINDYIFFRFISLQRLQVRSNHHKESKNEVIDCVRL